MCLLCRNDFIWGPAKQIVAIDSLVHSLVADGGVLVLLRLYAHRVGVKRALAILEIV